MNTNLLLASALYGMAITAVAQPMPADTITLDDVQVLGTRATANTPIAFTTVSKQDLAAINHGKDIPSLLQFTPSVLTTSDAGAGMGYSSMRVRGTDATRINVTINDIPLNDAESHIVYWVNTPDFASSLHDIQVQRGAGTSTNGAGAFGGSVNMSTQHFDTDAFARLSASYGSFSTHKATIEAGSGIMGGHWAVEGRASHLGSDGYRDRASSALASYYLQAGYFGGQTSVRFITFGGFEDTYHAWDGISREQLTSDRTYNPNGEIKHDGEVTGFYDGQKDIYRQRHYQLIANHAWSQQWSLNAALYFTKGGGYYKEYKNSRTLAEYLLNDGPGKSNLVRKKYNDNGYGGTVFALRYNGQRLNATLGGGYSHYSNRHFGRVVWVEDYNGTVPDSHEYYSNKGRKGDFNTYVHGTYALYKGLSAYLDMQYRHIHYTIDGTNDKWDWTATPQHMQLLGIDERFGFFNPKAGLDYRIDKRNRVFASWAVAQKEPTRNNYTDGLMSERPRPERLNDWEAGYEFNNGIVKAGANLYYMLYKDQLVLTGRLNEIGEPMSQNVPDSYRTGIELAAGVQATKWLRLDANTTLSRNRIRDYRGYVSDYNALTWDDMYSQTAIDCGNTTIAFSPSVIANGVATVQLGGFATMLQAQYVSRQYLDNFENREDSLDPYFVTHLHMSYNFALPHIKSITAGVSIYNLLNAKYETNGYSMTCALYEGGNKSGAMTLHSDPRFYPMAGTNLLAHITLSF